VLEGLESARDLGRHRRVSKPVLPQ
jgi:hypothetical protein